MQQSQSNQKVTNDFKLFHSRNTAIGSSNSESETDISTSSESLSIEQRYVVKNMHRVEPQGQENQTERKFFFFLFRLFVLLHRSQQNIE